MPDAPAPGDVAGMTRVVDVGAAVDVVLAMAWVDGVEPILLVNVDGTILAMRRRLLATSTSSWTRAS